MLMKPADDAAARNRPAKRFLKIAFDVLGRTLKLAAALALLAIASLAFASAVAFLIGFAGF